MNAREIVHVAVDMILDDVETYAEANSAIWEAVRAVLVQIMQDQTTDDSDVCPPKPE